MFTFKILAEKGGDIREEAGLCPENLRNKFTTRSNISRYNTRKIDDFEFLHFVLNTVKSLFWIPGSKYLERDPKANTRFCLIELLQSKTDGALEVQRHKNHPLEEQF